MSHPVPAETNTLPDSLDGWKRLKGYRCYRLHPGEATNNSIRNFVEDTGLRIQPAESLQLSIQALRFNTNIVAHINTASFRLY